MSLYLGENLISGNKPINLGVRNIGEIFPSLLPVTDAGAHLLDGSLILGGGIYQGFVDYIANIVSIYPDVFTTESAWQQSVSTYGVCGKFVYNATDNTVRLPKVTGIIEGTTDVTALGDLIEAGLPNITGTTGGGIRDYATADSGALYGTNRLTSAPVNGSYTAYDTLNFDASRSSSIYGNSTTVQPQTIKAFVYIVVANSTKTSIQVDIDEIATDLNNKAGTDLANVTKTGKILMSGMGMPSKKALTLTVGASGSSVTMPANGWLIIRGKASAANQVISIKVSGNSVYHEEERRSYAADNWITILMPVNSGDTVTYYYSMSTSNIYQFQFVYANGSKSEAS